MKFKVILSDLDGVIRHFPSQRDRAIETALGMPKSIIAQTAFEKDLLQKVTTGKISDEAWRAEIRMNLTVQFGSSVAERAEAGWSESSGEIDREVLNFFTGFKSNARLALLTNATSRLKQDLSRLGIWEEFDEIFNSSEIGFAKPDFQIFRHAVDALDCDKSEILFIDDSSTNVMAAQKFGLTAIHFKSLNELYSVLGKP